MEPSKITNAAKLAEFLKCDQKDIHQIVNGEFIVFDNHSKYTPAELTENDLLIEILYIPKRNKANGYRRVFDVRSERMLSILKGLNAFLNKTYRPLDCVQGFAPGTNIRTNAENHLAKKQLLSVDVHHFFESITTEQVYKAFCNIGFTEFASDLLSKIVTFKGFLPQGYTTSPTISNMVAVEMDNDLITLSSPHCKYTRYADDLYFSTNNELPHLDKIEAIIHQYGFRLNPKKTKFMKQGSAQFVTGLAVSDTKSPRIPRAIKKNLRLEVHYISKFGYRRHIMHTLGITHRLYAQNQALRMAVSSHIKQCRNRVVGWIDFIKSVEPEVAEKLRQQLYEKYLCASKKRSRKKKN